MGWLSRKPDRKKEKKIELATLQHYRKMKASRPTAIRKTPPTHSLLPSLSAHQCLTNRDLVGAAHIQAAMEHSLMGNMLIELFATGHSLLKTLIGKAFRREESTE